MSQIHIPYMQRCIELAQEGMGYVSPNPMVGCVIVHQNKIIAEGYHKKFGGAHAEVEAINQLKDKSILKECTLYVSLEPCAHSGKTPPCANLIVEHGLKEVVIGTKDPNEKVNGKGIEILEKAGIKVTHGVLQEECIFLNRRFFVFHKEKRPYIILKWAQTQNGLMAGGVNDPKYISGKDTLKQVHKWRHEEDAFMVGTNTVRIDNPFLTNRHWIGTQPLRISIDRNLDFDTSFNILNEEANTLIFNSKENKKEKNIEWLIADMEFNFGPSFTRALYERNIQSVVIEGGKILLNYFIKKGLWDEARVFVSKEKSFLMGLKAPSIEMDPVEVVEMQEDNLTYFFR